MPIMRSITSSIAIYFLIYGLVTFLTMRFINKGAKAKILTMAPQGSSIERGAVNFSRIFRILAMVFSLFIPFDIFSARFYIGSLLYVIGLILTTIAMWQFSRVELNRIATTGLYRITRHPMHIMFIVMLLGITVVANNPIFTVVVALYIITSYPMLQMQENYCIDHYGREYIEYMLTTPRVLLFNTDYKRTKKRMDHNS